MKDVLNFALIGCGSISEYHIKAINEIESARIVAVSDVYEPNMVKVSKELGVKGYLDYKEMLKRDDVDVVSVLTSSGTHAEIGIDAANRGKHVIVEKPMDVTLSKAQALIDACKNNNVKLTCIFQNRFNSPIIELKKAVDSGRLGKINSCCCHTKWYRDQNYYDCVDWRGTWELDGGGALMNQSIHYIDLMQYIMGSVDEVFGYTGTLAHENIEVEDVAAAVVKFKSQALGIIEGTTSAYPGFSTKLCVHGSDGSVIIEDNCIKSWKLKDGSNFDESLNYKVENAHKVQIEDFVNSIKEDREPLVTGEEGLKALKIILAIYKSREKGIPMFLK